MFKNYIDPLKKRQQDNFNTLHQTLEMRGNIYFEKDPQVIMHEWNRNLERTWVWNFYTEQDDIFLQNFDPTYHIKHDINFVPFNKGCTETVKFKNPFFWYDKNIKVNLCI